MGITTLTEGVETEEHYDILKQLGCDKVQGYLFSKPAPLDNITKQALEHTGLHFESEDVK